ncbi:hypothetical protein StoSoilA2_09710 [Arthrobacter sp. StoSoilA2]|nr:hypothetical protein StoSoilA2_09710 [Arthrobacter sp. StoSoilA2]
MPPPHPQGFAGSRETARSVLVCYFKVILPDHLFMLCRRFAAPLLHAVRRLCFTLAARLPMGLVRVALLLALGA